MYGGVNVYPAEVEAALTEHPDVEDAVVIGLPDEDWGQRVHAIVRLRQSRQPTSEELGAFVRSRLDAHKAPKSFEFVADFPRDASGKVRRTALVEERKGRILAQSSAENPAN